MANMSTVEMKVYLMDENLDVLDQAIPDELAELIQAHSYNDRGIRYDDGHGFLVFGAYSYDNGLKQKEMHDIMKWVRSSSYKGIRMEYGEYEEGCEFVAVGKIDLLVDEPILGGYLVKHLFTVWSPEEFAAEFLDTEFPDLDDEKYEEDEDAYSEAVDKAWEDIATHLVEYLVGQPSVDMMNSDEFFVAFDEVSV